MARKARWSLWSIENKFVRSAVALFVMTPIVALLLFVGVAMAVAAGVIEGAKYTHYILMRPPSVKLTLEAWWRAVTFRSTPC